MNLLKVTCFHFLAYNIVKKRVKYEILILLDATELD